MAYLGLARKYRPQKFSDLIGQEIIVRILQNSLKTGKVSQAYVFSGPKGVGKTSTARILAKALNCIQKENAPCDNCPSCLSIREGKAMNVIEIDAASHTSVENIRDLRENVRYASAEGNYKVYIIDEAHMLSQAAFNAFLKTLEEPPSHVVFVLATTEPRKIPITVLSRCQHLQFKRIPLELIKERLKFICEQEGIKANEEALYMIASYSEGSMRDALTMLDQLSSFSDEITTDSLILLIGSIDYSILHELTNQIINGDKHSIVKIIEELNDKGTDFKILVRDLIQFLRNLLVAKITGNYRINSSESQSQLIENLCKVTSEEHLILILKELINAEPFVKTSLFPRIILEVTLLRLSLLSHFKSINETIEQLKNKGQTDEETELIVDKNQNKSQDKSKESIADKWSEFLEKLENQNHVLAMKIKHAEFKFDNNEIKLIYNGGASLYADSVREGILEIQGLLKEFIHDVKITIHEKEIKRKDINQEAINNPLVKQALQLFEGRIYKITPKKGGNNV